MGQMGQTKEQGKNLQDQINDEEIDYLPKKEFRVLIIKTTLNLKSRREAQIKKTEEMFTKDLEELKNKQWWTTQQLKEKIHYKELITEGQLKQRKWISELEDWMVEIIVEEQNKGKKWKEMRGVSETSGTTLNAPTFKLQGSQKKRKINSQKIFEETIVKNFPNTGKEIVN